MRYLLPRLFFEHFASTSYAVEKGGEIIAFLVGFVSQTDPDAAYIHFVGVHPDHRRKGLGKELYELFFSHVRERGCTTVRCITSPVNKVSIAFHTRMGFRFIAGTHEEDGILVHKDYDGPGADRVVFEKTLDF
jgi:ribosomal protein S18 acetylase RimI-like enzyme